VIRDLQHWIVNVALLNFKNWFRYSRNSGFVGASQSVIVVVLGIFGEWQREKHLLQGDARSGGNLQKQRRAEDSEVS
jgi:hypothetical protein